MLRRLFCLLACLACACTVATAREIEFSGQRWVVRSSGGQLSGPGPNVFSDGLDAVRVDEQGRLHMAIVKAAQGWHSAEVTLSRPLGYGTYALDVETNPFGMDRQVVFGFFSYSSAPEQAHRELDVELSYWGREGESNNAQFVVQPSGSPDTLRRFNVNHGRVTYRIRWERGLAEFSATAADGTVLQHWSRTAGVPEVGDARIQLNLWLFQGKPPQNGQPVEFMVRAFRFTPSAAGGSRPLSGSQP
ncbi:hypothetical protein [Ralstonia sp. A12]|uniref:hypothetical protein n=1 Tax=Ralstonia sp. A12 TaxID=1217052 RepID=UPI0012ED7B5E|nr:hypothetical protein [Ralstonia sp. A12]